MFNRSLPRILLVLALILFVLIFLLFYIDGGLLGRQVQDSLGGQKSSKSTNIQALSSGDLLPYTFKLDGLEERGSYIEVSYKEDGFRRRSHKYKIDENTLLACLDDEDMLDVFIDYSSLDLWSNNSSESYLLVDSSSLNDLVGKSVKIGLVGDEYVSVIIVGGCAQ